MTKLGLRQLVAAMAIADRIECTRVWASIDSWKLDCKPETPSAAVFQKTQQVSVLNTGIVWGQHAPLIENAPNGSTLNLDGNLIQAGIALQNHLGGLTADLPDTYPHDW
jgi:hypothetical protein